MDPFPLHRRLTDLAREDQVNHHPFCGAHPFLDDGPCGCTEGLLAKLIRALIEVHTPRDSHSINTLACDEHNVTKGPQRWRDRPDYAACPDCVLTPIVVCSGWGCCDYPCKNVLVIADVLGIRIEA